jgi:hypothetical protein
MSIARYISAPSFARRMLAVISEFLSFRATLASALS